MIHILVIRDTKFWLVGPFENKDDASIFGHEHYSPGGPDDPRWQTLELPRLGANVGAVCIMPDLAKQIYDDSVPNNFAI